MTNYPTKKLGEICKISSGGSAPQGKKYFQNGKYPFFRTSDVGTVHLSDGLCDVRDYLNDDGAKKLKLFKKGTILFPKSGASTFLNHRVVMGCDGYVSSHLATITAKENINYKYLYFFLILIDAKDIAPNSSYPSLKISDLAEIPIPLPPIEIQKKIVERVERLMGKIDEAKKLRKEATADASALIPSALNKIFEDGKKKGWEEKTIGEISEKTKRINPKDFFDKEFSYIDITSVSKSIDQVVRARILTVEKAPSRARNLVKEGDIIFATTRPYLKNIIMIPDSLSNSVASTGFCVIRSNKKIVDPSYVYYVVDSNYFLSKIIPLQRGATYPAVSDTDIYNQKIPLPSLPEQQKIVKYLDSLSEKVRKIKTLQSETERELKLLGKSVLKEAFMV